MSLVSILNCVTFLICVNHLWLYDWPFFPQICSPTPAIQMASSWSLSSQYFWRWFHTNWKNVVIIKPVDPNLSQNNNVFQIRIHHQYHLLLQLTVIFQYLPAYGNSAKPVLIRVIRYTCLKLRIWIKTCMRIDAQDPAGSLAERAWVESEACSLSCLALHSTAWTSPRTAPGLQEGT